MVQTSFVNTNSTLRLSYGNVKDYIPSDAIHYDYYTIAGIIERIALMKSL